MSDPLTKLFHIDTNRKCRWWWSCSGYIWIQVFWKHLSPSVGIQASPWTSRILLSSWNCFGSGTDSGSGIDSGSGFGTDSGIGSGSDFDFGTCRYCFGSKLCSSDQAAIRKSQSLKCSD